MISKTPTLVAFFAAASLAVLLPSCEQKSAGGEVKETVNDALDRRPAEGVKDAAEDASDAAKDVAEDVKDAAKDAADDVKDATR